MIGPAGNKLGACLGNKLGAGLGLLHNKVKKGKQQNFEDSRGKMFHLKDKRKIFQS